MACLNESTWSFDSGDESRTVDQSQGDDEVDGFLFNTLRYSTFTEPS